MARLTGEEWGELRSALHSGAMLSPALIERCLEDEECWPMWRAARPPERSPEAYAYLSGEGGLRPESARWLVLGGEEMRAWWRVVGDDTSPLATLKGETICEEARELLEHGRPERGYLIRSAGRRLPDEVELVAWGVRLSREELIRRMPWRREG